MSTPTYFRNFPNIQYAVSANKAGITTHINIKDYFNLLKVREDIFREETLYAPYTIHNGQRPEQISQAVYGDEQFYWVILQINEITDYYNQWPLSELELTEYVYEKYGGASKAGEIHHWQTMETYDQSTPPNLVLPGQLRVPSTFIYSYPTTPGSNVTLTTQPYSVSNFDYERDLNEKKSQINILDKKYIYDYEREVRKYAENLNPSASFVDISDVTPGRNY
tara:strand:- start:10 stop:675 length:666 start_codon:yes stop_codon:yes gene_type:complete